MILKDKIIFVFGIAKFDGLYESTSFTTAKYLAKENDVFYIDYPFTIKDYVFKKNRAQFNKRRNAFLSSKDSLLDTDIDRLKILVLPPLLSINFLPEGWLYRTLLRLNEFLIVKRIKSTLKKIKQSDYLFINSFNFHYPGVGKKLDAKMLVYHCVDPLIVKYDRRHGRESEDQIVKDSQLVVCTSKQLYKEKLKQNKDTFFIPNAADIAHSSSALDPNLQIYPALIDIPKPVVGYFGNIERRIDFAFLQEVIRNNPDKSFVFAGPVSGEYIPADFKKNSNVYFIGRIPYKDMPAVLKGFDVTIIPFKKDEVSATIFPLKLFEYLGAGKPVVATDFNLDLKDFTGDWVSYCSNESQFSKALNDAYASNDPDLKEQRLKIALENTWEKRLYEFSILINEYYQRY